MYFSLFFYIMMISFLTRFFLMNTTRPFTNKNKLLFTIDENEQLSFDIFLETLVIFKIIKRVVIYNNISEKTFKFRSLFFEELFSCCFCLSSWINLFCLPVFLSQYNLNIIDSIYLFFGVPFIVGTILEKVNE